MVKKVAILFLAGLLAACGNSAAAVEEQPVPTAVVEQTTHLSQSNHHYDQLNDQQKSIYDSLYEGCLSYEAEVSFPEIGYSSFLPVAAALSADHPEFWWLSTYEIFQKENSEGPVVGVHYIMLEEEDGQKVSEEIEAIAREITAGLPADSTDYETVKYFYETIIRSTVYDANAPDDQDIRSVFLYNRGVCAGYAGAFKYLCDLAGIPCIFVSGSAEDTEGEMAYHTWNCVELDGAWYWVDPTWGEVSVYDEEHETIVEEDGADFLNLCFTDSVLFRKHSLDAAGKEDKTAYFVQFAYPSCTEKTYVYCVLNGCMFDTYSREEISQSIRKQYEKDPSGQIYLQFQDEDDFLFAAEDLLEGEDPYISEVLEPYYEMIDSYTYYLSGEHQAIVLTEE